MMELTEQVQVSLIASTATVLTAAVGGVSLWVGRISGEVRRLTQRDRLNWLYIKRLIDHIYKAKATPLPDPPPGWDPGD